MKIPKLQRPSAEQRLRRRLETALLALNEHPPESEAGLDRLAALVAILRPRKSADAEGARQRLDQLIDLVAQEEQLRVALRQSLLGQLAHRTSLRMFTDAGVLSGESFFAGLNRRIGQRLLPEELDTTQMRDAIRVLFPRKTDHRWVEGVGAEAWIELLDALRLQALDNRASLARMHVQMMEALQVVSYRIAAIGLDPELVRNNPAIERYESPFVMQNVELRDFLEERKRAMTDKREPTLDDKHLLVLLDQCEKIMLRVRRQSALTGASVGLTALLRRLEHNIDRQRTLLRLIENQAPHELNIERVKLFMQIVAAENRRYSVREWWSQTVDLLASRITQNASKAGEQYITSTRSEYFHLFRSAMGAGLIVALMATTKLWLGHDERAPFGEAVIYSANYIVGFVLMYLLHFSLATKQPAMTANSIARSLEVGGRQQRIETLAEICVRTFRSQFVAVLGNLVLAVPTAMGIAWLYQQHTGGHYIDSAYAEKLLATANPLALHVWIWGGITGIWLFLTGLVSGYYDNKAVYDRLPTRICQAPVLKRVLSPRRREQLARYVEDNFGGLVGSAFFGLALGSTAAIGRILGLPIDTLHVTFTAANAAFAYMALDLPFSAAIVLIVAAGVTVIGLMNLSVSFGLAIYVAMRAQRVRFQETGALLRELGRRAVQTPTHFWWAPTNAPPRELNPEQTARKAPAAQAPSGPAAGRPANGQSGVYTAPAGIVASAAASAAEFRADKNRKP